MSVSAGSLFLLPTLAVKGTSYDAHYTKTCCKKDQDLNITDVLKYLWISTTTLLKTMKFGWINFG